MLNLKNILNFKKFFTQIASEINKKIEQNDKDHLRESNENSFFPKYNLPNNVKNIIQNVQRDKPWEPNSIPTSILNTFKKEVLKPHSDI